MLEKDRRTAQGVAPGHSPGLLEPDKIDRLPGQDRPLPSIQIRAGEYISRKFRSWDPIKGNWGWLVYYGHAPTWPGEFRLDYWGGQIDFRVMSASFETVTKVFLPEWGDFLVGLQGQTERRQKRTVAFVLEAEGGHYVCIGTHAQLFDPDAVARFRPGPVRRTDMNGLSPYRRIGESGSPISSLSAEADEAGTITLRWDANGTGLRRLGQDEWRIENSEGPEKQK